MTEQYESMDYEAAYAALQALVAKLENPKNTIEENIALYEEACKRVLACRKKLGEAKQQIIDINERIARLKAEENRINDVS